MQKMSIILSLVICVIELKFACSNKNCSQYKKPVVRQLINLLDRKTTIEEDIEQ